MTIIMLQESFVAGIKHHPEGMEALKVMEDGEPVGFEREPKNKYDHRAVKILYDGAHIGYLPTTENIAVASLMDQGYKITA